MGAVDLQAGLDRLNEKDPPLYSPSALLANYRHLCPQARQSKVTGRPVSTAIDLKEVYATGWAEDGSPLLDGSAEEAILYRQGMCNHCGGMARSRIGRVVRTVDRPPVFGRVGRQ